MLVAQQAEHSVADPGFPVGGAPSCWGGGANLRHGYFLAKMYSKTKELDPVGGVRAGGAPLDPPMALDLRSEVVLLVGF